MRNRWLYINARINRINLKAKSRTENAPGEKQGGHGPGNSGADQGYLSVLSTIADEEEPPVFSRLQTVTSLPKGTLHRILKALILEGLVRYEPKDKTYHLGLQLLSLAYQVLEHMDIRDIARSELVRLRDLTGEAVHLASATT